MIYLHLNCMKQSLTVKEKLAFIEEIKGNVRNAFGGSTEELEKALDEVMEKLKNLRKLSEMTSKRNIEKTFVAHLAMSLASKMICPKEALDWMAALSSADNKEEEI